MKRFAGLPVAESVGFYALLKHVLSIILSTGIAYFIIAVFSGLISGDAWKYVQSDDKHYFAQFLFLLLAVAGGNFLRAVANRFSEFFFHLPRIDKYLYPIGFTIAYLVINEIFGM